MDAAGIVWVGPPAPAIEAMGSKIGAKELMRAAGVPTLPSITVGDDSLPDEAELKALGWPLLVKASAGGGGRGMRIVDRTRGARDGTGWRHAARRRPAFGDGTVFLERYLERPRHIEVQVVADSFGETVALFERECSIQRRHQKIIEEAPAPTDHGPSSVPASPTRPSPRRGRSGTSTPARSSSWSAPTTGRAAHRPRPDRTNPASPTSSR